LKNSTSLAPELFMSANFSPFLKYKELFLDYIGILFFSQSIRSQKYILKQFYIVLLLTKTKTISKKFAPLAARAIFEGSFFTTFDLKATILN
jgi:hypothetical protein